jgi:hypothetical protein
MLHPESATTSEYLPEVLSNQPDSGDRGHARKTHVAYHQFDCICGSVAASFAAPVDVIGAVWSGARFVVVPESPAPHRLLVTASWAAQFVFAEGRVI